MAKARNILLSILPPFAAKALGITRTQTMHIPWGVNTIGTNSQGADTTSFMDKGYGGNPYVHSVVKQIATKCAGIPWTLYRMKPERQKEFKAYRQRTLKGQTKLHRANMKLKAMALEEVDGSPLNDLLTTPNPLQAWYEFVESLVAFKQLAGNSFAVGYGAGDLSPNKGRILQMFPFRPDYVTIKAPPWPGDVQFYEVLIGGRPEPFTPEAVMHLKMFHPLDPRIGMSPIEAAFLAVKTGNNYGNWNLALTENMGGMPGILHVKVSNLTEAQREQMYERYRARQAGGPQAGLPFITDNEITWTPTATNPKDMEWAKGVQLTANQVALAFDWPIQLVGDTTASTFANVKEMLKYAYTGKVIPEMDSLRDGLNRWLLPGYANEAGGQLFLDYNLEDIEALQEDRTGVWDRALRGWSTGVLTLNQTLAELGFEGIGTEGDVRQTPLGLLGLDGGLGDPAAQDPQLAKALKYLDTLGVNDYRRAV